MLSSCFFVFVFFEDEEEEIALRKTRTASRTSVLVSMVLIFASLAKTKSAFFALDFARERKDVKSFFSIFDARSRRSFLPRSLSIARS